MTPLKLTREIKILAIYCHLQHPAALVIVQCTLSSWLLESMAFVCSAGSRFSFWGLPNSSSRPSLVEAELGLVGRSRIESNESSKPFLQAAASVFPSVVPKARDYLWEWALSSGSLAQQWEVGLGCLRGVTVCALIISSPLQLEDVEWEDWD